MVAQMTIPPGTLLDEDRVLAHLYPTEDKADMGSGVVPRNRCRLWHFAALQEKDVYSCLATFACESNDVLPIADDK